MHGHRAHMRAIVVVLAVMRPLSCSLVRRLKKLADDQPQL